MDKDMPVVNFKEHFDEKIEDLSKLFNEKISHTNHLIEHVSELLTFTQKAAREALEKSEAATKVHFAFLNEFDSRMKVVVEEQASKEWARGFEKSVDARFKVIENKNSQSSGQKTGVKEGWGYAVGAIGLAFIIVSLVLLFAKHT